MDILTKQIKWGISEVFGILALRILVVFILGRFILPLFPAISQQFLNILDRLILIFLTTAFIVRAGKFSDLEFKKQSLGKNIFYGLIGGAVLLVVATGTQHLFKILLAADMSTNPLVKMAAQANTPLQLAGPILVAGILAPVAEEIYYRGFAFPAFVKRWGFFPGIITSSIFFAAVHLSTIWFWQITIVGAGLALLYCWTGSIVPGIIAHSIVNVIRLVLVYLS